MVLEMAEKTKRHSLYVPDIATITEKKNSPRPKKNLLLNLMTRKKEKISLFFRASFWSSLFLGSVRLHFQFLHLQTKKASLNLCIRNIGSVSGALHRLPVGRQNRDKRPIWKRLFPV